MKAQSACVGDTSAPVLTCTPLPLGPNLLTNNSFENGAAQNQFGSQNWTTFGAAFTLDAQFQGTAQDGSFFMKIFGGNSGMFQDIAVTPGQELTASVYIQNASFDPIGSQGGGQIRIEFPGTTIPAISSQTITNSAPLNAWQQVSLRVTVPAGVTTLRYVVATNLGAGGAAMFDNANLAVGGGGSGDITASNDPGQCGAQVNVLPPLAQDNCGIATLVNDFNNTNDASDFYPVGTTTVTWTATDSAGNSSSCSIDVTVNDTEAPSIVCNSNVPANVLSNPDYETGSQHNVPGTLQNWLIFGIAAPQDVSITGIQAQSGNFYVRVAGANDGFFQDFPVNPGDQITASAYIYNPSGEPITGLGAAIKLEIPGQPQVVSTRIDANSQQDVWTLVTISATVPSNVFSVRFTSIFNGGGAGYFDNATVNISPNPGGASITVFNDPGQCGAVVNYGNIPSDNCGIQSVAQTSGLPNGALFPVGTTTNTFVVTDLAGNTASCSFDVTVIDNEAPTINCNAPGAPRNVLTNNSFENGASNNQFGAQNWTTFGAAFALDDNFVGSAQDGNFFMKMFGGNSGMFQDISINPGDSVTASVYIQNASFDLAGPGNGGQIKLEWLGTTQVDVSPFVDNTAPVNVWQQVDVSATAPAGATGLRVVLITQLNSGALMFDNASLVINGAPGLVGDVTVGNDPGQCGAQLNLSTPAIMDNCTGVTVTNDFNNTSNASGFYPVGTTTVTYTATDAAGFTASCSIDVTVNDTEAPSIVCPANITVSNDSGQCGAVVNYGNNPSDNCGIQFVAQISGFPNGGFFPIGTTTNTFVVVDLAGNSDTCSFDVVVVDNDVPTINCSAAAPPQNLLANNSFETGGVNNQFGSQSWTTFGAAFTLDDNFVGTAQDGNYFMKTFGGNSGLFQDITSVSPGDSVTATAWFQNASFDPTGPGNGGQVKLEWLGTTQVDVSPFINNTAPVNVWQQTTISAVAPAGATGVRFVLSTQLNSGALMVDNASLIVNSAPGLVGNVNVSNDPGVCGAQLNLAIPATMDNCPGSTITNSFNNTGNASGFYPVGTTTVTYTVTDPSGNTASCSIDVTVNDTEAPSITCPANMTVNNDQGQCGAVVNYGNNPTDNCGIQFVAQISGFPNGGFFPIGTTTNTFVVVDLAGNSDTCSFDVTVVDNEAPVINCNAASAPQNLLTNNSFETGGVNNQFGSQGWTTFGAAFTLDDNFVGTAQDGNYFMKTFGGNSGLFQDITSVSPGDSVTATAWFQNASFDPTGPGNGGQVKLEWLGTTQVDVSPFINNTAPVNVWQQATISAVAPAGATGVRFVLSTQLNSGALMVDNASLIVNSAPGLVGNVNVSNDPGVCGAQLNLAIPATMDNCPGSTITNSFNNTGNASGFYPVGTTTVTYTVTDPSGNTASCNIDVTVNDTEAPTITCPADMTVNNTQGQCGTVVNYGNAPNDNCGIQFVAQISGLPNGGFFPVGTTTNTFVVVDLAGNSDTCSFNVTVVDNELPTINCNAAAAPQNLLTNNSFETGGANNQFGSQGWTTFGAAFTLDGNFVGTAQDGSFFMKTFGGNSGLFQDITSVSPGDSVTATAWFQNASFDPTGPGNGGQVKLEWLGTTQVDVSPFINNTAPVNVWQQATISAVAPAGATGVRFVLSTQLNSGALMVDNASLIVNAAPGLVGNVNVSNDPGVCGAQLNLAIPSIMDNCPGSTLTNSFNNTGNASGFYPVGTTTVTYTVTDPSGNTATCSIDVTVNDTEKPTIICPADMMVNNDQGQCGAIVNYGNNPSDNCGIQFVAQISGFPNGGFFPIGTTTNTFVVVDLAGNTDTCSFDVTVVDNEAPVINCSAGSGPQNLLTNNSFETGGSNNQFGSQGWTTFGAAFTLDANFVGSAQNGTFFMKMFGGNSGMFQDIALNPGDSVTAEAYIQNASFDPAGPGNGGQIKLEWLGTTQVDVSPFVTNAAPSNVWQQVSVSAKAPAGATGVRFVLITQLNSGALMFDNASLVINSTSGGGLVGDVNVSNDTMQCGAELNLAVPAFFDNCPNATIVNDFNNGADASGFYPVGTTVVTYTVTDASGNSSSCSINVTVNDTELPAAVCNDITIKLDKNGNASIMPADIDGGSSDNCGIASMSVSPNSFTCQDLGANTVTLTVTDSSGNSSTCTSTVTVGKDNFVAITCPADIVTNCETGNGGAFVHWKKPEAFAYTSCDTNPCTSDTRIKGFIYMGEYNGHRYYCSKGKASWMHASQIAQNNGGYLAAINDAGENQWLSRKVLANVAWIGLSDAAMEGTFTWSNGDALSYTRWLSGEPNNKHNRGRYEADYGVLIPSAGKWRDRWGGEKYEFVMELPCGGVDLTVTQIAGPANGGLFPGGTSTVTYVASDGMGATDTCSFTVTVEEEFDIVCPDDITVACKGKKGGAKVSWKAPDVLFNTCDTAACSNNSYIPGYLYMGEYGGSRYYFSWKNVTWSQANALATSRGGHLASIQSSGENNFLANHIWGNQAWIGFNDAANEGTFVWANGETVNYTNWMQGEPNNQHSSGNYSADYAILQVHNGKWRDRWGGARYGFIMEIPCKGYELEQVSGPASGSFFQENTTTTISYIAYTHSGDTVRCSFDVTVEECPLEYCDSRGKKTRHEWIEKVEIGSISNRSGNDHGYGDYTNLSTTLTAGGSATIKLTPGFARQSYKEYWRVWIDWNRDGDFFDQGEMVVQTRGNNRRTETFNVPMGVASGDLRMRVSMRWGSYAGPCSYFSYGEVEDYTITVSGGAAKMVQPASATGAEALGAESDVLPSTALEIVSLYPNPVSAFNANEVQLEYRTGQAQLIRIAVTDLFGRTLRERSLEVEEGPNRTTVDVTDLPAGTYIVQLKGEYTNYTTKLVIQ